MLAAEAQVPARPARSRYRVGLGAGGDYGPFAGVLTEFNLGLPRDEAPLIWSPLLVQNAVGRGGITD